jgi:hypothetical protein
VVVASQQQYDNQQKELRALEGERSTALQTLKGLPAQWDSQETTYPASMALMYEQDVIAFQANNTEVKWKIDLIQAEIASNFSSVADSTSDRLKSTSLRLRMDFGKCNSPYGCANQSIAN